MESLKNTFDQTAILLADILRNLEQYKCLSEQNIIAVISSFDALRREQQRCIENLCEKTGCGADQCQSLSDMQKIQEEYLRKCQKELEVKKHRQIVDAFCRVVGEGDYGFALADLQSQLRSCADQEIEDLAAAGKLDIYQKFVDYVKKDNISANEAEIFISGINAMAAFGLLAHKYVITDTTESSDNVKADVSELSHIEEESVDNDNSLNEDSINKEDCVFEEFSENPAQPVKQEETPVGLEEESTEEVPETVDEDSSIFNEVLLESSAWPEFIVKEPGKKPKGESALLSHYRKVGPEIAAAMGIIASDMMSDWLLEERSIREELSDVSDEIIERALRYFEKEGYIYQYSLKDEDETGFLLSKAGFKILNKSNIRRVFCIPNKEYSCLDPVKKFEFIRLREVIRFKNLLYQGKYNLIMHTSTNFGHIITVSEINQGNENKGTNSIAYLPLLMTTEDEAQSLPDFISAIKEMYSFCDNPVVIIKTPANQQQFWVQYCKEQFIEDARYFVGIIGQNAVCDMDGRTWEIDELIRSTIGEYEEKEPLAEPESSIGSNESEEIQENTEEKIESVFLTETMAPEVPTLEISETEISSAEQENSQNDLESLEKQENDEIINVTANSESDEKTPVVEPERNPVSAYEKEWSDQNSIQDEDVTDEARLAQKIVDCKETPSWEIGRKLVIALLASGKILEGTLLSSTLPLCYKDSEPKKLSDDLIYATHIPLKKLNYSQYLVGTPENQDVLTRYCRLSAAVWTLCFPQRAYDYDLYVNADALVAAELSEWLPERLASVKNLMSILTDDLKNLSFQYLGGTGLSEDVLESLASDAVMERKRSQLMAAARERCSAPRSNINITGYETMMKACMGPTGELGMCMKAVSEDDIHSLQFVRDVITPFLKDGAINESAIIRYIDDQWDIQKSKDKGITLKRFNNGSAAQRNCCREIERRLDIACEWLRRHNGQSAVSGMEKISLIRDFAKKLELTLENILLDAENISNAEIEPEATAGIQVFVYVLKNIQGVIRGEQDTAPDARSIFVDLLTSPYITLSEDGIPMFDSSLQELPGMEPWRLVVRHILSPKVSLQEALTQLEDGEADSERFEDFGSANIIRTVLKLPACDYHMQENSAIDYCDDLETEFCGDVRLACAYGRLAEETKDTVFSQIEKYRALFIPPMQDAEASHGYPYGNYSHYRMVLNYLRQELAEEQEKMRSHFEQEYLKCVEGLQECPPILKRVAEEIRNNNFAMAEEFLVRYHAGELDLPTEDSYQGEFDFHNQFIANADAFCEECEKGTNKGNPLSKWAPRVLQHLNFWTSTNERNAQSPCEFWITRKGDQNTPARICKLLDMLGIHVANVSKSSSHPSTQQYEVFEANAIPLPCNREDYSHPVKMFGTQLASPLYIVCTYGCKGASTLIDIMADKLQLGKSVIVLMDGTLTLLERRKVASKFKRETSGQNSFLLIDRVLMLYLSALDSGNRSKAMLQCTLPYTYAQLYVEGAGAVSDEMFIGRVADRKSLSDPEGTCLVYGGRQLGKTALLRRVESINNNAEKKYFSVYIDIKEKGSDYFLQELCDKLGAIKPDGKALLTGTEKTIEEVCRSIIRRGESFNQLLVLIDEVDCYFEEISKENYNPLHPIVVMQDELKNKVKFVFAGTHNVAATRKATENNSDIIKLRTPLCIQPLSKADATKLIRKPLSYLGFEIGDQQIALILANTNSYPGLIHLFCNALVKSICENYDQYYSEINGNPPYTVSDEQLRLIFRQQDIKRKIADRVIATIKLDTKYRIVSNLLAFLEYEDAEKGTTRLYGYSPDEIQQCNVKECGIPSFMPDAMSKDDLEVLMDEMEKMGILWKNNRTSTYRFRQRDFISFVGTQEIVEETLLKESEC